MVRTLAACMILWTIGLSGCIAVGGTSNECRPTLGRQLIELKAALDAGALTQAEYNAKKAQFLAAH